MPQSLSNLITHVVFSTKNREAWIIPDIRPSFHAAMAEIIRSDGGDAYRVGGTADHVHLAISLKRTQTVSDVVKRLKRSSNLWFKAQSESQDFQGFQWQRGYGAFSISRSHLDALIGYIDNQEEHHRKMTFQDEYRQLLSKYEIQYDEKYVWD